jgi:inhibitor of KinA
LAGAGCIGKLIMKWRQYGRNGVLIEFAERADESAYQKCRAISDWLSSRPPPNMLEFVPGYTSVLIEFDLSRNSSLDSIAMETVRDLQGSLNNKIPDGPLKTIRVVYNGPDLNRVASHNKITVDKLISLHSSYVYKVHLLGFSPGFPYLGKLHNKLHTPRLDTPRVKVPAGSVAIGGKHTGIYTINSPGGWNLIGQTDLKIFDLSKVRRTDPEDAFLLKPGDRVRFLPTG